MRSSDFVPSDYSLFFLVAALFVSKLLYFPPLIFAHMHLLLFGGKGLVETEGRLLI